MDVLPADKIENYFFKFDDASDTPINSYFDVLGYKKKNSLRNLGSAAIYFFIAVFLLLCIYLMDLLITCFGIQPNSSK